MSSYITSPFTLEERRLRGIVSQCAEDLALALQRVADQQALMRQRAEEEKKRDRMYFSAQQDAEDQYQRVDLEKNVREAERKKQLKEALKNARIELAACQNGDHGMESLADQHRQLLFRLENSEGNLDELEEKIGVHVRAIESKIRQLSAENYGTVFYTSDETKVKRGEKGVSLQTEEAHEKKESAGKAPLDVFIRKLNAALESPYGSRFPSLARLEKEFASQPEYARAAFAVRHMQNIDELIRQLELAADSGKMDGDQRRKAVLRYRAACDLMGITADAQLLEDERSTRKLTGLYQELIKQYEERKKHAYVSAALSDVMERHGILFQDSAVSDGGSVMHFSMEHASVDVSGTENNHLVMEVAGEYDGESPTMNERRKSVSSARHLCSLLKTIETELKEEYGIVFGTVLTESPDEETMVMRKTRREAGNVFRRQRRETAKTDRFSVS